MNTSNQEEENTMSINHIEAMLDTVDVSQSGDISDPHIHNRKLQHIAHRVNVPPHTITNCTSPSTLSNILDIPRPVAALFGTPEDEKEQNRDGNLLDLQYRTNYIGNHQFIIEMITGKVFDPVTDVDWGNEDPTAP